MRLEKFQNPTQMRPKTDLGMGSTLKLARKLPNSISETNSKIHELKTPYDETTNNPIYGKIWRNEAIDKEL